VGGRVLGHPKPELSQGREGESTSGGRVPPIKETLDKAMLFNRTDDKESTLNPFELIHLHFGRGRNRGREE